jgi:hypothetical protein
MRLRGIVGKLLGFDIHMYVVQVSATASEHENGTAITLPPCQTPRGHHRSAR